MYIASLTLLILDFRISTFRYSTFRYSSFDTRHFDTRVLILDFLILNYLIFKFRYSTFPYTSFDTRHSDTWVSILDISILEFRYSTFQYLTFWIGLGSLYGVTIRALLRDANKSKKILRSGSWLTAAPGQARCLTVLHQMYSRSQDTLWERYRLFFNWSLFSDDFPLGKVQKKNIKKPTNVSLYASMSAENSKMLVFFTFFFVFVSNFPIVAWEKKC